MKVIAGLGNPGRVYERSRHNVGFIILDIIKEHLKFGDFKDEKKFKAQISSLNKDFLIKPNTFMNLSGESVSAFLSFYKVSKKHLIVIHDDIDLVLGEVKISFGQGPAGHNGVQSIMSSIGTQSFWRIRIGILSRPKDEIEASKFVLGKFTREELKVIRDAGNAIAGEIKKFLYGKLEAKKFKVCL